MKKTEDKHAEQVGESRSEYELLPSDVAFGIWRPTQLMPFVVEIATTTDKRAADRFADRIRAHPGYMDFQPIVAPYEGMWTVSVQTNYAASSLDDVKEALFYLLFILVSCPDF